MKHSAATLKKMSDSHKGQKAWNKGKDYTGVMTLEKANQIRQDHKNGLSYSKLVIKYDIGLATISRIINNKRWI